MPPHIHTDMHIILLSEFSEIQRVQQHIKCHTVKKTTVILAVFTVNSCVYCLFLIIYCISHLHVTLAKSVS